MRYTVEITQADFISMQYYHRRFRLWLLLIIYLAIFTHCILDELPLPTLVLLFVLLLLIFCATLFIILPWQWRRIYGKNKMIRMPREFEFTEQSLTVYSEYGSTTTPWADFVKWKEMDKAFFIYSTCYAAHCIPKRIFATEEEQQTLRTYLTQALGSAK